MPEGPEVHRIAQGVKSALKGSILDEILFVNKAKHERLDRISLPQKIVQVEPLGKKILIGLENGSLIVSELKMSGYWSWVEDSPTHTRLVFLLQYPEEPEMQYEFYFVCIRNFAITRAYVNKHEQEIFYSSLGPDVLHHALHAPIPKRVWYRRFKDMSIKRKGSRPYYICDALLEQKIFSGIGNYLRADILWEARIHPCEETQKMTKTQYERLRTASHKIILKAYQSKGSTFRTYRDVEGQEGRYTFLVYGQHRDPLGNKVSCSRFKTSKWPNRSMYWVPKVQKISAKNK